MSIEDDKHLRPRIESYEDFQRNWVFPAEHRMEEKLHLDAHYSDWRFRYREQVVFDRQTEEGEIQPEQLSWDYSDRLYQWNPEKADAAWKSAKENGAAKGSAQFLEQYLSAYYEKPIKLWRVVSGVNRGNGYPYNVFGYEVSK